MQVAILSILDDVSKTSRNQLVKAVILQICIDYLLLRATAMLRASKPSSRRLSVCPSVRPSHPSTVSKRCKLKSQNLYPGLPRGL